MRAVSFRFTNHTRAMLDLDFKVLPFQLQYPTPDLNVPKPACVGRMIEIAEALSKDELFIRVGLYDRAKPFFGELTLHRNQG
jgi:hypothetical protein